MKPAVAWRTVFALLIAAVLLGGATPRGAAAQTRADSAAVLLETARRFEGMGRLDVADALYEHILERFADTPAGAEVRRIRAAMPADRGARSGRVELQVWSTLYGAALGLAVPQMLGADGAEAFGVGLLVGAPAGFLLARAYARSHQLTEGQARAITFGGTWGAWQGLGWALALDEGGGDDTWVDLAVAGSIAGIAVGGLLARKPIPTGLATTVNFGALWGTWFGVATGVLLDRDDVLLEASLIGGNAGLLTTAIMAPRWQMSRNRARLVSVAGLLGGIAGAGVLLIAQPDDEKVAILFPLAGSIAGLAVGAVTTRDHDRGGGGAPGGAGGGDAAALLDFRGGSWRVAPPVPYGTVLEGERALRPGVGVTLLRARF